MCIKKICIFVLTSLLVACSSEPNKTITGVSDKLMRERMGAIYEGRQYISPNRPLLPVIGLDKDGYVVNQADFLAQLSTVQQVSPKLAKSFNNTYNKVLSWVLSGANTNTLSDMGIDLFEMRGDDGYENVLMTGYYSPVLHARRTAQGKYQHPIYAMPKQKRFTRAQIYNGALSGKGLELAYSNSMLDNFLLGVQGSGYVDFGDGNLNYFAYAGQNGFKYTSIGRLLVEDGEIPKEKMSIQAIKDWAQRNPSKVQSLLERNPSYVFFRNDPAGKVKGSAGIPLIPNAALASDRSVVPSGSIVLVEEPIVDNKGYWTGKHQLRLMMALDVGGAVNGQHFDLYQGIGDVAGHRAGLLKHYGRAWILR